LFVHVWVAKDYADMQPGFYKWRAIDFCHKCGLTKREAGIFNYD
jgi:hypothetical protein